MSSEKQFNRGGEKMNELSNCLFIGNIDWVQFAINLMFVIMITLQQSMIRSLRCKVICTETVIQNLNNLLHSILPNHQK